MEWYLKAVGNAAGYAIINGNRTELTPGRKTNVSLLRNMELYASSGKIGDSEDSFLYYYCKVDPYSENFTLEADLLAFVNGEEPDQQSAFGLMATDTDASDSGKCRHRNQIFLGLQGQKDQALLRVVAGYTDPAASEGGNMRLVDPSRVFESDQCEWRNAFLKPVKLVMKKTDSGFTAVFGEREICFPGCDFLTAQEPDAIYVGIAAARKMGVRISNIRFEKTPGRISPVPEGAVKADVSEYPFSESYYKKCISYADDHIQTDRETVFVSTKGSADASGAKGDPVDLQTALCMAYPGIRIVLEEGIYTADHAFAAGKSHSGKPDAPVIIEAEVPGKAVLDGSALYRKEPVFLLLADCWNINGLVFRKGSGSGLIICGSGNVIEECEAYENEDTGIQIISHPGAAKEEWPEYNTVKNCSSHDNCDPAKSNADGFGAKLRVGKGNAFFRVIAYHNADDGFDLYTKSIFGPISPVELDRCVAYENGSAGEKPRGIGFKLGGENQAAAHEVWNCIAFGNRQYGFSSNSNPSCRLHFCNAFGNGESGKNNYAFYANGKTDWIKEKLSEKKLPGLKAAVEKHSLYPDLFSEKKNILIMISSLGGGGAERVACRLASELSEKHNVWLAYFSNKEQRYHIDDRVKLIDLSSTIKNGRTKASDYFIRRMSLVKRLGRISGIRIRNKINATISLLEGPNLYNVIAPGGTKKILSERNDPSKKGERYKNRAAFCYNKADYVVFQSERVQKQFPDAVQRKSCIIHNPVEVSCTAASDKKKKIVTVGRLVDQKNHNMLINAFAEFYKTHPEYHLYIYGKGELLEELVNLSETLGVKDCVHFDGFVNNVHEAIKDAEMFVLSSDFEGLSNALMEAMMMGLPCISTDCTGTDELMEDDVNGLVVPVGDKDAMCAAMTRLSADPALRERLSKKAMLRAQEFKPENIIRKWERILG